ncbi:MAG TPA: hypothetical protein VMZ53_28425 [Kofleriaceae bacterium]|nr:hypothetical protein [Kofleriaceae bacterium]
MLRWLAVIALLVACKDKEQPKDVGKPKIGVNKGRITYVSPRCAQAVTDAMSAPPLSRPELLIHGCHVCGLEDLDWKPILEWNLNATRPEQLQAALETCDAFCTGDSKLKFMAGADNAKGTSNDTPWRKLADTCGDRIDLSSDHRFMSAAYFALDRIARAVGGAPGSHGTADKLATITLPLPALTVAGTGVVLPSAGPGPGVIASDPQSAAAADVAITILGDQIYVGKLPVAKLTAKGVEVDFGPVPYPGKETTAAELPAALKALGCDKTTWVAVLAPTGMPAGKLVPIVVAAAPAVSLHLGVAAAKSPPGWQLPAMLASELSIADNGVQVTADMPVQKLVALLVAKGSGTIKP